MSWKKVERHFVHWYSHLGIALTSFSSSMIDRLKFKLIIIRSEGIFTTMQKINLARETLKKSKKIIAWVEHDWIKRLVNLGKIVWSIQNHFKMIEFVKCKNSEMDTWKLCLWTRLKFLAIFFPSNKIKANKKASVESKKNRYISRYQYRGRGIN